MVYAISRAPVPAAIAVPSMSCEGSAPTPPASSPPLKSRDHRIIDSIIREVRLTEVLVPFMGAGQDGDGVRGDGVGVSVAAGRCAAGVRC